MDNVFYITYNYQLVQFMKQRNIRYGVRGVNPKNSKTFWVYDRTGVEFNTALDEWIANRDN
jgi:hypothetical protein